MYARRQLQAQVRWRPSRPHHVDAQYEKSPNHENDQQAQKSPTWMWALTCRLLQAIENRETAVVVSVLGHHHTDSGGGKAAEVLVADKDWNLLGLKSEAEAFSQGDARGAKNLFHS